MIYINVNEIDKADPAIIEKVRNEFNRRFCLLFTDYLLENNYINKEECKKIKAKYQ